MRYAWAEVPAQKPCHASGVKTPSMRGSRGCDGCAHEHTALAGLSARRRATTGLVEGGSPPCLLEDDAMDPARDIEAVCRGVICTLEKWMLQARKGETCVVNTSIFSLSGHTDDRFIGHRKYGGMDGEAVGVYTSLSLELKVTQLSENATRTEKTRLV